MRKFIIRVIAAAGLFLAADLAFVAGRIAANQSAVEAAFDPPKGTDVIFIGNSHTGCSFAEAPEFRNWVVWRDSTGFPLHYVRFLEFERRGALDGGVKAVVMDCDWSSLKGFQFAALRYDVGRTYPLTWRYLPQLPMSTPALVLEVLLNPNQDVRMRKTPPADSIDFAARMRGWTPAERAYHLGREAKYACDCQRELESEGVCYPPGWRQRFEEMVLDMKARCDRRGIRLVLVAPPVSSQSALRTNAAVWQHVSDMAERVRELGVEHDDFRTACPDEMFHDEGHLMRRSAYAFTRKFYEDVLRLPVGP